MENDESTKEPKLLFTGPKFNPTKKYGLIIPNKTNSKQNAIPKKAVKPCIFDEDEDDDISHEKSTKPIDTKFTPFNSNTSQSRLKKQTQIAIEKALSEDPSVFEYDNVYEEMEKEKNKIDPKQKEKDQNKEVI